MIYYCADDYGLCDSVSRRIEQCIETGVLNKISIFPNFDKIDFEKLSEYKNLRISLHLNLVEGKCLANADEISMIADKDGRFLHTFGGLFRLWLFHGKQLEEQLYREIKAQVLYFMNILPKDTPFCIDSHQHTHMIPAVLKALVRVLKEEKISLAYMRIPAEPLGIYWKTPSLYATYSGINLIKQWLLRFLWRLNQPYVKNMSIPTSYFMGILFSGKMDEKRVKKILPKYEKLAEKKGWDIEVLFHPGYLEQLPPDANEKNIVFQTFYLSENRKQEYESVIKLSERRIS